MTTHPRSGFTFVHMSIVLVVIGLIIGGVLMSRDLIFAAQVRAQVAQIEKYNAAVSTFINKYDCIPGDCANAATAYKLGSSSGPGGNGNGDGLVNRSPITDIGGPEVINFWYHLKQAGLIDGNASGFDPFVTNYKPGIATPALKLPGDNPYPPEQSSLQPTWNGAGGMWVVAITEAPEIIRIHDLFNRQEAGHHVWFLTGESGLISNPAITFGKRFGIYSAFRSYALDAKLDDGKPRSGNMRTMTYRLDRMTSGPPDQRIQWAQRWSCTLFPGWGVQGTNILYDSNPSGGQPVLATGNAYNFKQNLAHGNSIGCSTFILSVF